MAPPSPRSNEGFVRTMSLSYPEPKRYRGAEASSLAKSDRCLESISCFPRRLCYLGQQLREFLLSNALLGG